MKRRRDPFAPATAVGFLVFLCACDSTPTSPFVDAEVSTIRSVPTAALAGMEQLGKSIFFDEALSLKRNQSCASCHDPAWGFSGPNPSFNAHGAVYEGSVAGKFGNRRPPTAAYATPSPIFALIKGLFIGGNFWDGRATGEKLGNPAADQAQGPFLNPVEQALPDNACVIQRVCTAGYPVGFEDVFGAGSCTITWPTDVDTQCAIESGSVSLSPGDRSKVDMAYDNTALAISAYESSGEVNAFSSRFDLAKSTFTKLEQKGFSLFKGKGKCAKCHTANGKQPLFTDFSFDNLGVPKNSENPVYSVDPGFVDYGLGDFLRTREWASMAVWEDGKQKVPTLRNVDKRDAAGAAKAYMHNGYFKTLEQVIHFYNTRDLKPTCTGAMADATADQLEAAGFPCWPAPEVAANVNTSELGDLRLTPEQEAAIVAFMKTLSDF